MKIKIRLLSFGVSVLNTKRISVMDDNLWLSKADC